MQTRCSLLLAALSLAACVAHAAPSAWSVDYARWPAGQPYTKVEATRDWPTLQWFDAPSKASIAEYPANSTRKWLRVDFPAGKWGGPDSGIKFAANLAAADSYTLEYEVYFPPDWEFSQNNQPPHGGGKLPGISGGSHPSGGLGKPDGMSARPMWRRDARFSAEPQNYLELYLYWPRQTEKYGDRFFAQAVEAGRTYRIKLRVDLGALEHDGFVKMWIDGALRVDRVFRFLQPGQSWKLSQYMHNVFYGGNDPTWAPARDQFLLLGPVRIGTAPF